MKQKGFTIIELIVVIAIISILAGIVMISVNHYQQKAKATWVLTTVHQIQTALDMYKIQYGYYPCQMGSGGDPNCSSGVDAMTCGGSNTFASTLQPLVNAGFLGKIPNYSNPTDGSPSCFSGYRLMANAFEYETDAGLDGTTCNGQPFGAYGLMVMSSVPLPGLGKIDGITLYNYYYCLTVPR